MSLLTAHCAFDEPTTVKKSRQKKLLFRSNFVLWRVHLKRKKTLGRPSLTWIVAPDSKRRWYKRGTLVNNCCAHVFYVIVNDHPNRLQSQGMSDHLRWILSERPKAPTRTASLLYMLAVPSQQRKPHFITLRSVYRLTWIEHRRVQGPFTLLELHQVQASNKGQYHVFRRQNCHSQKWVLHVLEWVHGTH